MQAPELPPFGYQLVKDRTTKKPATGAGELSGYGIIAGKGDLYSQTIRFSSPVRLHEPDADFLLMYWIELK